LVVNKKNGERSKVKIMFLVSFRLKVKGFSPAVPMNTARWSKTLTRLAALLEIEVRTIYVYEQG
jgi:hypothetical protein